MAAYPVIWNDFIENLEGMVAERQNQLAPLASGEKRMGRRGADTGFEWVDITEAQAQSLRNEIANLRRTSAVEEYRTVASCWTGPVKTDG